MKVGDRVQITHENGKWFNQCGELIQAHRSDAFGKTWQIRLDNGEVHNAHESWLKPTDLCAASRANDLANALEMSIWVLEQRKHFTDSVLVAQIALFKKVLKGDL